MAKVVIQARLPGRLREILQGHTVVAPSETEDQLAPDRLSAELADAEGFLPLLSFPVDEALLERAPRLRVVANYAVGYDNIDVPACTRRGVVATHTPGVLTEATADLAMTLILAAARRLREGMELAASGRWAGWAPDQITGLDLDGATLGIIGLGRIGQAVATRARAFGMDVIHTGSRDGLPFDELLARADVVSLHCPLTPATRHLIDARALARMKPSAVLVNTARGPIIDEPALIAALERGHLGGVGLDVFEREPHIPPALLAIPRVICLPHIGSAARGARTRMAEMAARSIADVLAGRRPAHPLNATS